MSIATRPHRPSEALSLLIAGPSEQDREAVASHAEQLRRRVSITEVDDAASLHRALAKGGYDMAMVDLALPDLDVVAPRLADHPKTFVVALSEKPAADERIRLKRINAQALVRDPEDADALDLVFATQEKVAEPIHALVVDPNPLVRRAIALVLSRSVFRTSRDETDRGEEAVRVCAGRGFDLVILDVGLPGLDGGALVARMRAAGHGPKIILMSTEPETAATRQLEARLFDGFLQKPFYPRDLDRCLREIRGVDDLLFL